MTYFNSSPVLELLVRSVTMLTPRVKAFELVASNGDELPSFEAGAHLGVLAAGTKLRRYSLLNDPAERHRYVIAVLRERDGTGGSTWMHDSVREGDRLFSELPKNTFPLNESASEHILIAGGIGITPLLSMTHRLDTLGQSFTLHYCTRNAGDTAFYGELFGRLKERIVFHHDGGDPARGLNLLQLLHNRQRNAHVYICGPRPMIDAARLAAKAWPADAVHFEIFTPTSEPAANARLANDQTFEIALSRSALTFSVPSDKSILDVLVAHGIACPWICKEGWCGTCRTKVLSGKIDHRDEILDDDAKASNSAMQICVSRALPGQKLVLDL
ncbi:2Fe-2S iron-sulfur cluster-binding protein [Labrys sp. KB_33_2]|uniref:PDR/VanB family oxidoreductase n=1 Tax=Labrys sp. KB_33_2 TaxID=3237479 RepID=UPI003F90A970